MTAQPHDALIKVALSRPAEAAGMLRTLLPPSLLAQVDLTSLRLSTQTFVTEALKQLHGDLVFEVTLTGRPGFVCFLLYEHQSTVDRFMAARVLEYLAAAWAQWRAAHPDRAELPPILPVVLYHGPTPWSAPTAVQELIDLPEDGRRAAGELLPTHRFTLDDLSRVADTDLRAREVGVFTRLTLLLLKHARSLRTDGVGPGTWAAFLPQIRDLLVLLPDRGERTYLVSYIIEVGGLDPAAVTLALGPTASRELKEDVMNAAEKLREEGKLIGKLEGKLEGKQEFFLQLLRAKFGPTSAAIERRVRAADEATLQAWAVAVLKADRLDDVWSTR